MDVLGYLLVGVLVILSIWFDRASCEACGRSYSRSASRGRRRDLNLCVPCYRERTQAGSCVGLFVGVVVLLLVSWFVSRYLIGLPPLWEPRPSPQLSAPDQDPQSPEAPSARRFDPPGPARSSEPPLLDDPRDGARTTTRRQAKAPTKSGAKANAPTPQPLDTDDPRDVRR